MKLIKVQVQCRGCKKGVALECEHPSLFKARNVPFKCFKCGSKLLAEIRKPWFKRNVEVRVSMLEHTKTLLNILKRRGLARPHA
jgi:hypothetical protein